MLTDAVVSIPANTNVMPKAKTIGHALGDGNSIAACYFLSRFHRWFQTHLLLYLAPDDVNYREDNYPHCIHEMPVEGQYIETISVLLFHVPQKHEC